MGFHGFIVGGGFGSGANARDDIGQNLARKRGRARLLGERKIRRRAWLLGRQTAPNVLAQWHSHCAAERFCRAAT